MIFKSRRLPLVIAFVALCLPFAGQAQWWKHHPAYLHAMSDLRMAAWLLEHHETRDPLAKDEERRAIGEIRAAYKELREASIVDDKDINDRPPADMNFYDHRGRLHHALDLLREAHHDVEGEEDDPAARDLKHRALRHIDEAAHATDLAIHAWNY